MSRPLFVAVLMVVLTAVCASAAPAPSRQALPAGTLASCSWQRPGHDPYMGEMGAAVDRYADIPAPVRARLKERMAVRQYDDLVEIRRDRIQGRYEYGPAITDMHFGNGRICHTVSRAGWSADMLERGLVYCEQGQCIIVPTVCRNVSRVTRSEPVALENPLLFDAPGAGPVVLPQGIGPAPAFADVPIIPYQLPSPVVGDERATAQSTPYYGTGALGPGQAYDTSTATGGSSGGSPTEGGGTVSPPVLVVPEPSTWALLLLGAAAVAASGRRRRRPWSGRR